MLRFSSSLTESPRIRFATVWLPSQQHKVADAVAAGRLDEETAARLGYRQLGESVDLAAPEMAVLAAKQALVEANCAPDDLALVVHCWLYYQGHDFWSPPHYVAHQIGALGSVAVGIQQTSNGCVAGLEVAATRMAVDPAVTRCLVTTADRFVAPGFDRWFGDVDVAYGDGATALLLDRNEGPYRLLSVVSVSAPEFEVLYRGDDTFSPAPRHHFSAVNARRTKLAFKAGGGWPRFIGALRKAVQQVVRESLAEAELTVDDPRVRYLTMPRIGAGALTQFYKPVIDEIGLRHTEVLDLGRGTGHLGAGDAVANLADLHIDREPDPGTVVLLLSTGNGHTWSCLVVQRE